MTGTALPFPNPCPVHTALPKKGYKKGAETDFIDLFLRHCRTRIDCKYSIIPQAGSQEKPLRHELNLIDSVNT
jgi:hypothetical protein